jgi:hypothetical protein
MSRFAKTAILLLLALAVALSPAASALAQDVAIDPFREEQDTTAGFVVFDFLLVRPLSLFATGLGSAVFVLSYPIAMVTRQTDQTFEKLVKEPADYTFTRPLGFFPDN